MSHLIQNSSRLSSLAIMSRYMSRSSQGQHIFKIKQQENYSKIIKNFQERNSSKLKKDINIDRMIKKFQQNQASQQKKLEVTSNEATMSSYFYSMLKSYFVPVESKQ
ncbi:hypothetical protein PPL_00887 [Heterostelium album PN500]|uniref:Uncharacterized protein n=1 Tax=Heterostelium pallidum (strain ATCC 26659 / Pp 5 / PN500) TaxID=670386 RepID=D3AYW8_HETP5|nr:hypothetical protein PPL_00887 [Heterostelium album PN500]EFA85658.1 hypothetical protein PPL_00887 [Heterostelium album PN500]|eukprot:XP_020437765.1 hypothetical protein PPL_00887 [Heterostelium album PN500]